MSAKSLELQHTIRLIRELDNEIAEIEEQIQSIMDELHSPITTIPGLGFRMAAMILAEVGDFTRFDSPDKLLAYAGMSPSTYQSGQLKNCYPHMEKRGSRYLRYALYNAAKYVCHWDPTFADYLAKKRAEGKHYNVALSHAAKKVSTPHICYGEIPSTVPFGILITPLLIVSRGFSRPLLCYTFLNHLIFTTTLHFWG